MTVEGSTNKTTLAIVVASILLFGLIFCTVAVLDRAGAHAKMPPNTFSIFYTCDTRGHIEPCGCASGMAGGISRRQTYLSESIGQDFLLVDAGDVAAGPRMWEILELEYILKGYEMMGYHAVNVGHREISLSLERLNQIKQQYDRFVSANVLGPQGRPVFQPYVVTTLSNGYRCAIVGVADDRLEPDQIGKGLTVAPPVDALTKYMPELNKNADFIVVLAFMDEPKMKAIARQFFEVDVIIGGKVLQASGQVVKENRSVIVFNTDKGKTVGRLDIFRSADPALQYDNDLVVLEESVRQDPQIEALVEEYKEQLKERDFQPHRDDEEGLSSISAARSKTADTFVGPLSCKTCHPKAYSTWESSAHAHAFETLEKKGHQYNPRCLQCHTVGYMASDGYLNQKLTPKLTDVSCEACHGRGHYHVEQENERQVPVKRVVMKTPRCDSCHDNENSPKFEHQLYWERIAHDSE
jgi:hypothetical protein